MCGYRARYLKETRTLGKKHESTGPAEIAIKKLIQYLGHISKPQTGDKVATIYKKLLGNKKISFVLFLNETVQLAQIQPVLNLVEKYSAFSLYQNSLSVNEYMIKPEEKTSDSHKLIKYPAYEKARGGKPARLKKGQSPRTVKRSKSKNKLAQSLKKLTKDPESLRKAEEEVAHKIQGKIRKHPNGPSLINKSYDTILNDRTVLPQIDPKKGVVKRAVKYKSIVGSKLNTVEVLKENEELKARNKELLARIAELEKTPGKGDNKLLFEYERKISGMELAFQSAQIKLQENDKLITQLLQTIDYLNQGGGSKKPAKIESKKGSVASGKEKTDSESAQFLFNKSELVQSHTQIKQTKYMIFEGFKALQEEITKKYGNQGRIIGTVDYLLGSLDALFGIIHQLEIKELQYLNLLANNQPIQKEEKSPVKSHKQFCVMIQFLLGLLYQGK
eukprot:TRINITY_DN2501_c0_g1_i1.p1 TRINITY_DN2501_c0_g1~~TRINITY_DN2501_c0_g1_i1.p1  ORF type:complete len:446 (+),score=59.64 TRINITY_DN2501_c0_g1_i1:916-2253(+)